MTPPDSIPTIEELTVKNYRVLRNLELKNLTPFTVFLGPNGSGKSTIFDVFAFLSECFQSGLVKAWEKRGRFKSLRSHGVSKDEPIEIEIKYREKKGDTLITYHLSIAENAEGKPVVSKEWLQWRRNKRYGIPYRILNYQNGDGYISIGDNPEEKDEKIYQKLSSPDTLAVSTLGLFEKHPRVSALRKFITDWHLCYLSVNATRKIPEAGAQERLSDSGDNLANVIQYLSETHPQILDDILEKLSRRVPRLESVSSKFLDDGRLCLMLKDSPFTEQTLAKYASDGTLRLLAYLVLLHTPALPKMIGIEEPENQLHPKLLRRLAEEFEAASASTQIFITTHSPYFVNGLDPREVRVLFRGEDGFTQSTRIADMKEVVDYINSGSEIGSLWMEGILSAGDPYINPGRPQEPRQTHISDQKFT